MCSNSRAPIFLGWGFCATAGVLYWAERIPVFRERFFSKLPLSRYDAYRKKEE